MLEHPTNGLLVFFLLSRALTDDPVRAGCDHVFCRTCLDAKFKNFDTQESFTACPICKSALPKQDITNLTPKSSKFQDILQKCVIHFCEDANLDLSNFFLFYFKPILINVLIVADSYVGPTSQKVLRTYSRKQKKHPPEPPKVINKS